MQENGTMIETMNSIPIVICQGIAQTLLRSAYMLAEFQWIAIGIQFEQKKTFFKRIFQKPWNWFKNNGYYEWDISRAWQTVSAQYEYIKENYCGGKEIIITSPDEIEAAIANNLIQAGDLLYFKAGTALHHSVIITQVTNNMIYYAGHTDSYFDKPLNEGMETDSVVILHLQE